MNFFKKKRQKQDYAETIRRFGAQADKWVLESWPLPPDSDMFLTVRLATAFVAQAGPMSDTQARTAYRQVDDLLDTYRGLSDVEVASKLDELLKMTAFVLRAAKDRHDISLIQNIEKTAPHSFLKVVADAALDIVSA
jgi:hypothetical protein